MQFHDTAALWQSRLSLSKGPPCLLLLIVQVAVTVASSRQTYTVSELPKLLADVKETTLVSCAYKIHTYYTCRKGHAYAHIHICI